MNLRQRMFFLGFLSLLPAALVVLYLQFELRSAREAEARDLVERQTQQASSEIMRIVEGMKTLLITIASASSVRAFDVDECTAFLVRLGQDLHHVHGMGVMDLDGNLRCASRPINEALNYRDRAYFNEALAKNSFVVGAYAQSRVDRGVGTLPFAMPIMDESGSVIGVVSAGLDLKQLNVDLQNWAMGEGSALTIADRGGMILARNPQPERFVGTRIPDAFQHWVRAEVPGTAEAQSQDGTVRVISYIPPEAHPAGLYLSTGVSKAVAFDYVDHATRISLIIMMAGILGMMICLHVAGKYFIRRPVDRLLRRAAGWSADPPAVQGPVVDGGEFGEIGRALNRMGEAFVAQRAREQAHQAHLKVLLNELNHRVKNTFTVVQSIVGQGLRNAHVDADTRAKIEQRLVALARSHDLLTEENWNGSSLDDVVRRALEPFGLGGDRARSFEIEGEPVQLTPRQTLSLGMAFHELATNAVKYGALSGERGRIRVGWTVRDTPDGRRLAIHWQETDGPSAAPPTQKGFGSRLIERSLARELDGEVTLNFEPSGASCAIDLPLAAQEPVDANSQAILDRAQQKALQP